MEEYKIKLYLSQTQPEEHFLKICKDPTPEMKIDLFYILPVSIGSFIFLGIILTICIVIKRRYDKNKVQIDVNPDYGKEDPYNNYYADSNVGYGNYEQEGQGYSS